VLQLQPDAVTVGLHEQASGRLANENEALKRGLGSALFGVVSPAYSQSQGFLYSGGIYTSEQHVNQSLTPWCSRAALPRHAPALFGQFTPEPLPRWRHDYGVAALRPTLLWAAPHPSALYPVGSQF
jgi:hypothetical protein